MLIAFIGSVFSPYYARSRRGDPAADPLRHCAINLSLYRGRHKLWTMTERGRRHVERDARHLRIGPSSISWEDGALKVRVDELTAPWPRRIRGEVLLRPRVAPARAIELDTRGRHLWWPLAPLADVEVSMSDPALRWRGVGYLDSNRGGEPLEDGFERWSWARAHRRDGRTAVVYDALRSDGTRGSLALLFGEGEAPRSFEAPPASSLGRGLWGVHREIHCDDGHTPRVLRAWEDGPFYTRSLVTTRWLGEPITAMHECLDLTRFSRRWVQALLPFRMPRVP